MSDELLTELITIAKICDRAGVPQWLKFDGGVKNIRVSDRVKIMIHRMSDEGEIFKLLEWEKVVPKVSLVKSQRKLTTKRNRRVA